MWKNFLAVVLLVSAFVISQPARARGAENKTWGVGVNLGEPLGLNTRFFFLNKFAGDLTVGYGFGEEAFIIQPSLLLYLRHILDYDGETFSLVPYFGAGMKAGEDIAGRNDGKAIWAMRFPVGFAAVIKNGVVEITVEFGPGVEFTPDKEFDLTGGLGLRYYFF